MVQARVWVLIASSALIVVWGRITGAKHFGGMDMSAVLNAAQRFLEGQKFYQDASTVAPPLYLLFSGWSAFLFGEATYLATIWFNSFFAALSFALLVWLGWEAGLKTRVSFLLALLLETTTLLLIGTINYNTMTSLVGSAFVLGTFALLRKPDSHLLWIAWVVTEALLSLLKPNLAGLLLLVLPFVVLFKTVRPKLWLFSQFSAVTLSLGILKLNGMDPGLILQSYLGAGGRLSASSFEAFLWTVENREASLTFLYSIPLLSLTLFGLLSPSLRSRLSVWVLFLLGVSIIAMGTNNEFNCVDLGPFLVGITVWTSRQPLGGFRVSLTRLWALGIGALLIYSLNMGWERDRIKAVGIYYFYEDLPLAIDESSKVMKGIWIPPFLQAVLADMQDVKKQFAGRPRPLRIFFGPRIEFGYSEFSASPPVGLPLWWPGTGEVKKEEIERYVATFKELRIDYLIFLRGDYTYIPPEVLDHIKTHYIAQELRALTIYVRR